MLDKLITRKTLEKMAGAVKLIRKVDGIMHAQKRNREFGDYLAELRVRFKPKRNFIKLLDGVGDH